MAKPGVHYSGSRENAFNIWLFTSFNEGIEYLHLENLWI
jgi:hypothetical protein